MAGRGWVGRGEGRGEGGKAGGSGGRGGPRGAPPSHRSATGGGSALLAVPPSGAVLFLRRHTRKFPAPTLLPARSRSTGGRAHAQRRVAGAASTPRPPSRFLPHTRSQGGGGPRRGRMTPASASARPDESRGRALAPRRPPWEDGGPSYPTAGWGTAWPDNPRDGQNKPGRVIKTTRLTTTRTPKGRRRWGAMPAWCHEGRVKPTEQVLALSSLSLPKVARDSLFPHSS